MALTPDEDEDLRRLEALARFGQLAAETAQMRRELRQRDRRRTVRDPQRLFIPLQRSSPDGPLVLHRERDASDTMDW
ncbi:MAG: hypothetical protein JO222_00735 [Frankiales bacterium]|nr:hypothetical protein [Frankiales bacterium]